MIRASGRKVFLFLSSLRRQRNYYLVLLLCAGGCASQGTSVGLNSERIRQSFGTYGVDVLSSDNKRRISSLYSIDGRKKTTRTYAVVDFVESDTSALAREHALVGSGDSIGEVFRAAGWSIEKRHLFIGEFDVPAAYAYIGELMRIALPQILAVHVYHFVVNKNEQSYSYARITEIHHPDYLSAADLQQIYGEILFDDSMRRSIGDFIGAADKGQ